ncbi:MAG TPA: hypothetical protein VLC73_09655 [Burkholderiales bacterium]|nr:hypothetical protein [Burkholderiales bacterium]
MPPQLTDAPLFPFAVLFGILGIVVVIAAVVSFIQLRLPQSGYRMLAGLFLLTLGALAGAISVGMLGYRALTREEVAARIAVKPAGPQRFLATFKFADGRETTYDLAGDEIYVDAHILKWSPYANMIGLHTAYEIDRVAGRYHKIKDEREAMRTVHALGRDKTIDLYALRRRYSILSPLFDAEYGSATFVPVTRPAELELRVSITGLLMRETKPR